MLIGITLDEDLMNDLIVLAVKNLRIKLEGKLVTPLKRL